MISKSLTPLLCSALMQSVLLGQGDPAHDRLIDGSGVSLVPGPTPGLLAIDLTTYAANNSPALLDLSVGALLEVNGGAQEALGVYHSGSQGQALLCDCFPFLDQPCPTINGKWCKRLGNSLDYCMCYAISDWTPLGSLQLAVGDVVKVSLYPAPGAVPELVTENDSFEFLYDPSCPNGGVCVQPYGLAVYGAGSGGINAGTIAPSGYAKIGTSFSLQCGNPQSQAGTTVALEFFSFSPLSLPFLGGTLLIDPAYFLSMVAPFVGPTVTFPVAIPNDPALVGGQVYTQGVYVDLITGSLRFTDGGVQVSFF
jgi:hypothetical protein